MKKTLLLILDGLGLAENSPANALYHSNIPTIKKLLDDKNMIELDASGLAVGLPKGFIGNSEVGHLNIGAGAVVYQDMTKIDLAIEDKSFYTNPVLIDLLEKAKKAGGRVHFMGLLSDAGVHSHIAHLHALIDIAEKVGVRAYIHPFLDGRDTAPQSAKKNILDLDEYINNKNARIASICGRFYAMDRDKRWERIEEAYNLLVSGEGISARRAIEAIDASYEAGITDEFIKPHIIDSMGTIKDNDAIFFFNFRADRAKELASAFTDENFTSFARKKVALSAIASMTLYDAALTFPVAFAKDNLENTLGERISAQGYKQLRIAETEKYAHVTYFFNGGREEAFNNEERILIPSPKDVDTYDKKPEMAMHEVVEKLLENMRSNAFDFIVCNIANPDMVGHTGNLNAAVRALEFVDTSLEQILKLGAKNSWRIVLTSDHGNIEQMLDSEDNPHTAHTLNKVPLILLEGGKSQALDATAYTKLADIAKLVLGS